VLSCFLYRRRIGAYLDGALEERAARTTAAHLTACTACQAEAGALRRLRTALRRMSMVAEPDWTGFWPGVVRGIDASRHAVPARAAGAVRAWRRPRWAVSGVVAALVLVSLTVWQMTGSRVKPIEGQVLVTSADTEDPNGTVMVYSTPERDVAVVWVFGLD
jgi:anti-sigma factor ChrR (cupin superfamily)